MPGWLANWFQRHQHPASLALHAIGIPLAIAALVLAIVQLVHGQWDLWWRPAALLVGGYVLQWIGHAIEGNDMGELILFKKLAGKDYVAISPRYNRTEDPPASTEE
jgi:hypothetical protein